MRQEKNNGVYIKIADANENDLNTLKIGCETSKEYANLTNAIKNSHASENKIEYDTVNEKEKYIQEYYDKNYKYYAGILTSNNEKKKFDAACNLLSIDPESYKNIKISEEKEKFINFHKRRAGLLFHTDKIVNPTYPDTHQKATEIFNLAVSSGSVKITINLK